ncbi:cytochrome c biogenesis heme-transporting ATPase CcmA [Nitrosomonas sp. JL21]|uniref:cytochrome c biogenesis heme-transporting ATPase CcmA n=1 Tax=Nitrosomonas sp. JL21 TaxID=153949 RepID=UPI001367B4DC|nr:cytochrome c biogenesis heme-transporting ATPase CcmA [Nitrosomonas sp. JL21]MBL8497087.1 cytochrome c biogenesis heme-transporting ATPase CcmA [Nitrosomonas sp.]MCC7090676.1 cytochrome c biogenesis heme-transporting ATPase CcmA [Nitrosomonas sp.]MXS78840.1 cytochrome c biogenesis heme-transporting ATPase CcmA [Nitrosomonas sp. JL21]
MLQGINLACVRGDRELFKDINFLLESGGLMQVRGPNGSGKTSLLRMLCGLSHPAAGDILWEDQNIRALDSDFFAAVTYIGHLSGTKDDLTVLENLQISSALAGMEISTEQANDALHYIGLKGREALPVKVLSQGQRRRVALARLLVCKTSLWILDEPLVALDVMAVKLVRGVLEEHLQQGGMVVMTTHQEIDISAASIMELQLA